MRAAKVQASLHICAVSPEPPLLALSSSETRGTSRQKARSLAPLNGWACAVKICHDGMLEDTNSLDGAQLSSDMSLMKVFRNLFFLRLSSLSSEIFTMSLHEYFCQLVHKPLQCHFTSISQSHYWHNGRKFIKLLSDVDFK